MWGWGFTPFKHNYRKKKTIGKAKWLECFWGLKLGHRFQYNLAKLGLSAVKFISETIKRTTNQKHVFICIESNNIWYRYSPLNQIQQPSGHAFHQLLEVTAVQGSSVVGDGTVTILSLMCRVLSGMLKCYLIEARGTLVFNSLMAALLTSFDLGFLECLLTGDSVKCKFCFRWQFATGGH